jgi:hypothetical protein
MNGLNNRQYVGARYVPKIMGEWNKALQYEALSVVTYKGNSFTSKVPVPSNVEITDGKYWVNTGNYNAQIANLSEKIKYLENYLTPEMFGAFGDGVSNDTVSFNKMLEFAYDKKMPIILNGEYKISKLNINNYVTIIGNSSKIICNKVTLSKSVTDDNHTIISNITFDTENGILINGGKNIIISGCTILTDNIGVEISRENASNLCYENIIENCCIYAKTVGVTGILINTSDCTINNVNMRDFKTALKANFQVLVYNLHAWLSRDEYIKNSVFIECTGGSPNYGETEIIGCCIDTYQTGFLLKKNPPILITNTRTTYNSSIWTSDITPLLFNIDYAYAIEYLKLRVSANNFDGFYAKKGKISNVYIYPILSDNLIDGWKDIKAPYNMFNYFILDTEHLPSDKTPSFIQYTRYDKAILYFSIEGTFNAGKTQLFYNAIFPNNKTYPFAGVCNVSASDGTKSYAELYADNTGVYVTLKTSGKVTVYGTVELILPFKSTD